MSVFPSFFNDNTCDLYTCAYTRERERAHAQVYIGRETKARGKKELEKSW